MVGLCSAIVVLLLTLNCASDAALADEASPIVNTSYGPIQGLKFISSWTKKPIYSFKGIPYASPPVGNLRFKDPIPPPKWSSVRDCTIEQSACSQAPGNLSPGSVTPLTTSEDCLYLNVYTPQQPHVELLPVMVFVHGGGFTVGSGNYEENGPDFLVGESVVVVTLNYRLGALGFLTLGSPDIPGNAGLKDQSFALKWVQREIHRFGGDPGQVTLFGESAGSSSVHLQYLSPVSKGLFQRVIGESGASMSSWAVRDNGVYYGLQLAEILNCSSKDMSHVKRCLMTVDANAIVAAQSLVKPYSKDEAVLIFIPTIDKNSSVEPFLPELPDKLIEQKQGSFVPFIMGINSEEGFLSLGRSEAEIINTTNNLDTYIPPQVKKSSTESRIKQLTERIKQFYFKNTTPSYSNLRGFIDLNTDSTFGYPTVLCARSYRERSSVYLYYFTFNGKFKESIVKYVEKKFNISGVSHAEELSYIFVRRKVNQTAVEDSNEMKTWRRMVKMWTNFAKFGKPTVDLDPTLEGVTWSPVGNVTTRYLHIGVNLTMVGSDLLASRMALWDSITPSSSVYLQATCLVVVTTAILCLSR